MSESTTKARAQTWTQAVMVDLLSAFHAGGVEKACTEIPAKYKGMTAERVTAKLMEHGVLSISDNAIGVVDAFLQALRELAPSQRMLALRRLRAGLKEAQDA